MAEVHDIYDIEDIDGVRLNWNSFPVTRLEANEIAMPVGALYTPLLQRDDMPIVNTVPVQCRVCHAILNPFCNVDFQRNLWTCSSCQVQSIIPPNGLTSINNEIPVELNPASSTIEYILPVNPTQQNTPPIYLYIIDLCQEKEDFDSLKNTIVASLALHPPGTLIGLITFDSVIAVYELGFNDIDKKYCYSATKPLSAKELAVQLGLVDNHIKTWNNSSILKFFVPLHDNEFEITAKIENLKPSSWVTKPNERPIRATGTALSIASSLLESSFLNSSARILLFAGGPCTYGDGIIVDPPRKEPLRSHHDIIKSNAKHYKKANQFYTNLSKRANGEGEIKGSSSWAIDIFVGCYDQTGIYEMKWLCNNTGGNLLVSDSFTTAIFKQSFFAMFTTDDEGYSINYNNGQLYVLTSPKLKVSGMVGHGSAIKVPRGDRISDTPIGKGLTNKWKLNSISPRDTYAVFFEMDAVASADQRNSSVPEVYIQFQTNYQHTNGQSRLRVTTIKRATSNTVDLTNSFDQEAAIVLLARLAIHKVESGFEEFNDLVKWLDKTLVKLCYKFGDYVKGNADSFQLGPIYNFLPQFMYHLRRSPLLQVFGSSPDETAFYHHHLLKVSTKDALTIIQPTLTKFSATGEEPAPVLLDSSSLAKDSVLLLDAFFFIVIHYGETAAQWRDQNLNKEDYPHLYEMFDTPKLEAADLIKERFPLPRYITTDEGKSQARFLLSKLNPSDNDEDVVNLGGYGFTGDEGGKRVLTEDVSLKTFFRYLAKLVIEYKPS